MGRDLEQVKVRDVAEGWGEEVVREWDLVEIVYARTADKRFPINPELPAPR